MRIIECNLNDNVYRVSLCVVVCLDTSEWDEWLNSVGYTDERHDHKSKSAMYYRLTPDNNKMKNNNSVIFLRNQDIATLVHELTHFVFNTLDEKGVPIRIENDEAFAYYIEYWVNEVRNEWSQARRLRKGRSGVEHE